MYEKRGPASHLSTTDIYIEVPNKRHHSKSVDVNLTVAGRKNRVH
jgi:hypothetical protein